MVSLRQRIRKDKINCMPWKIYRYEVERLPISAQCLFAKGGISIDVLEMELRLEGWLFEDEILIECLASPLILLRRHLSIDDNIVDDCPFDDTWTEDDYIHYYKGEN